MENEKNSQSLILGLDISTACIGISIIYDDGVNKPKIELISHVSPKIDKNITGIEALILRKDIFEKEFLLKMDEILNDLPCPLKKITDCVIESPLIYSSGGSNAMTVASLLQFNGLLSEGVYKILGIVPHYISSYDARMISYPSQLLSIRKFNKKGVIYPISHIKKALEESHLILFGSYPFDCDKKSVMMNLVCDEYPDIPWIYNKKGELKKENYDSCDALVCALAYYNQKKYGELDAKVDSYEIKEIEVDDEGTKQYSITYKILIWGNEYVKKMII